MAEKEATPEVADDSAKVSIHFRIPTRMPSVYAHHLSVQEGENEVLLSFFEVVPPVFLGKDLEERLKEVQESGLTAECVARVIIAKKQFPRFAAAIAEVSSRIKEELKIQAVAQPDAKEENDA